MTVVVTGAAGTAGRAVTQALLDAGYEVRPTDVVSSSAIDPWLGLRLADLTDYGEAVELLAGADAVVHLAGIPGGHLTTGSRVFHVNTTLAANVLLAAARVGVKRVVWASSETLLGVMFSPQAPPRYVPMDDDHTPHPTMTYALSKLLTEVAAEHIATWSGMTIVGLRLSHIRDPESYASLGSWWADPSIGQFNLWSYVDARDAASAILSALEADLQGSHNMLIAAADTIMNRPTRELLAEVYPDVEVRRELGEFESLIDCGRARELIGYVSRHSWREHGIAAGRGGGYRDGDVDNSWD